jgi:hypothetical protein
VDGVRKLKLWPADWRTTELPYRDRVDDAPPRPVCDGGGFGQPGEIKGHDRYILLIVQMPGIVGQFTLEMRRAHRLQGAEYTPMFVSQFHNNMLRRHEICGPLDGRIVRVPSIEPNQKARRIPKATAVFGVSYV